MRAVQWDARTADGWGHLVDANSAIVNLAGENLAGTGFFPQRWSSERKQRILQSRLDAGQAVVEAVNNTIEHAYGGQAGHRVDIEVALPVGWMVFKISCEATCGADFSWPDSCNIRPNTDCLQDGGRGIYIINRVMDSILLENTGQGQVLTMKKRLPAGA